jgi:hypothetical protein
LGADATARRISSSDWGRRDSATWDSAAPTATYSATWSASPMTRSSGSSSARSRWRPSTATPTRAQLAADGERRQRARRAPGVASQMEKQVNGWEDLSKELLKADARPASSFCRASSTDPPPPPAGPCLARLAPLLSRPLALFCSLARARRTWPEAQTQRRAVDWGAVAFPQRRKDGRFGEDTNR